MSIIDKLRRTLRGEVSAETATRETMRRLKLAANRRRELASLEELNNRPARLRQEFAQMRSGELLAHFRARVQPQFLSGFQDLVAAARLQQELFPEQTQRLLSDAEHIVAAHCWPLLGFGEKCFGKDEIRWNRDPLSGFEWPLTYHADLNLFRHDGSDARVVWELNRFSHFLTLGRAYAISGDERFSAEFSQQLWSWREQNPVGRGVNWNCAMEVALRAMNLLAAFSLFLSAPQMDEVAIKELLRIFDQHGDHIQRNLEFSYIATSNHYLSDVVGLLWLGLMLPELSAAVEWREFGLRELLSEMDKQVLADGADYEAATGYHRFALELFLYSFVLCHLNGVDIEEKYWSKLRAMVEYLGAYLRPDGRAALIGDSDSGRVLPLGYRPADDHAYLLAIGAAVFRESCFKFSGAAIPEELLWFLGEEGIRDYDGLQLGAIASSQAFAEAAVYVLRQDDLYLLFNVSGSGVNGRGSHGHNDVLSIEVSACGAAFIIDPGTYVYTANLQQRHLFRSTAYHSTVSVDNAEQNEIEESLPFIIRDEAQPRVLEWQTGEDRDLVTAEHSGYRRLPQPVTHRRSVRFDKRNRRWQVEDHLLGQATHDFNFRFHLGPEIEAQVRPDGIVELCAKINGARLLIVTEGLKAHPTFEPQFSSGDYGQKAPSISVCWSLRAATPLKVEFSLIPVPNRETETTQVA